jgi:hypothetical protein
VEQVRSQEPPTLVVNQSSGFSSRVWAVWADSEGHGTASGRRGRWRRTGSVS